VVVEQGVQHALISLAGPNARFADEEFFSDLQSEHTVLAYRNAVKKFLNWCHARALSLDTLRPGHVSEYIKELPRFDKKGAVVGSASKPTRKLHLAAIRKYLDRMVERHALLLNVAHSVKGPGFRSGVGKTNPLRPEEARRVWVGIDASTVLGCRDRAIIATMIYTAARVGSIASLKRRDFYTDTRQWYLSLNEKGGLQREIPCRLDLQEFIEAYLSQSQSLSDDAPLFLSATRDNRSLSSSGMTSNDIYRMVRRRMAVAGLPKGRFSCHSFRAGTATDLLDQGLPLADVQELLGHSDPRTTRIYDHRSRVVTRNIVERISNWQP